MVDTPRTLNIIQQMPPKIEWIESTNLDNIGSIYIYRASSKYGTYSLIGSVGSVDGVGSPSIMYTHTNGKDTYWYAVSFYDGTNTSIKSNKVSPSMFDYLCDVDDVKRITGIVNELSDDQIREHIAASDQEIFQQFGKPVLDGNTYTDSQATYYEYDFTEQRAPIYRMDLIEIAGSVVDLSIGSIQVDINTGFAVIGSSLIDTSDGGRLEFEFIPQNYNLLSQYQTALDIFLTNDVLRTTDVLSPRIDLIKDRIESLRAVASMPGIVRSTEDIAGGRLGKAITQDFQNIY